MTTLALLPTAPGGLTASLAYHLAWIFSELGLSVLAADLDPEARLTAMFLSDEHLEAAWSRGANVSTVPTLLRSLPDASTKVAEPAPLDVGDIGLLAGDPGAPILDDALACAWRYAAHGDGRGFHVLAGLHRLIRRAAEAREANLVLVELGAASAPIRRAALLAADHVLVPLAPDPFSLRALRGAVPALRRWCREWSDRRRVAPADAELPAGRMAPVGYVVVHRPVRLDRPVHAAARWFDELPRAYRAEVLAGPADSPPSVDEDPYCLAALRLHRALAPLAREARKPMFALKPADGATGALVRAVQDCALEYRALALRLARATGIALP